MTKVKAIDGAVFEPGDKLVCPCGAVSETGGYVSAHWYESLRHTCPKCGRVSRINNGTVEEVS